MTSELRGTARAVTSYCCSPPVPRLPRGTAGVLCGAAGGVRGKLLRETSTKEQRGIITVTDNLRTSHCPPPTPPSTNPSPPLDDPSCTQRAYSSRRATFQDHLQAQSFPPVSLH